MGAYMDDDVDDEDDDDDSYGDNRDGDDDGFWKSHHSRSMAKVPRGPTHIHHFLNK